MNQIFGYQVLSKEDFQNNIVFGGAQPVCPNGKHGQVKIFIHPHTHLQSFFSPQYEAYVYVWGIPVHPNIPASEIPGWCLNATVENCYNRFKELLGTFIVIIDEPKQHRITFVNDILGMRPMFLGNKNGHIVFGSDVWAMFGMGLSDGKTDYDSVSSWIAYGYNCTNGSLFTDLHRLPPGSAIIFQNGQYKQHAYAELKGDSQVLSISQVVDELHAIVSSTVNNLLAKHSHVSIALSGGYDSRYLCALSSALLRNNAIQCVTVSSDDEGDIASKVAEKLGVSLTCFLIKRSVWDLYNQVYHFMADGFPISKFVPHLIANHYPALPMINGFLGGLLRNTPGPYLGKYETECEGDLADVLQHRHTFMNFKLIRQDLAKRIQKRARVPMEEAVRMGKPGDKVFTWSNLYHRQRCYISNNFLQHLGITDAILPFYSWELLSYIMKKDNRLFIRETYQKIFEKYFPELAEIPHSSDLPYKRHKIGRCIQQWAIQLLPVILNKSDLPLLVKKQSLLHDIAGCLGYRKAESSIMHFQRLYLLEKRLRDEGLDFDWESI